MPRRHRLTPKNRKRKQATGGDPDAPTHEEWEKMPKFKQFIVEDNDNEQHVFRVGAHVLVLPPTRGLHLEMSDYWLALIRDIRSRSDDPNDVVWVRVQWYYSGAEIAALIKSFEAQSCGKYERIFSDHYDYVHCSTFEAVTTVYRYEEAALEPDDIQDNFFCRYDFEQEVGTIKSGPGSYSCFCHQPYSPDDPDGLMHFCPRPSCRKAYHRTCLLKEKKYKDQLAFGTRPLRLLAVSPDDDQDFMISEAQSARKTRGKSNSVRSLELTAKILSALPRDLVRVAQQPIIKGARFESGGVVGNVTDVICARRLVYAAVQGTPVPINWKEKINVDRAVVKLMGHNRLMAFVCPNCGGAI